MREKYDRINWVNGDESLATPLSADNLNRMDKAIFEISETMDDLNLDAKAEEIRSLVVQAQDYSAAAEESAKKAMSTTPEGYEKIALAVRTNELAYLGWSVPYEMPIQNYVDANRVFHQRVGRIDLGSKLSWTYSSSQRAFSVARPTEIKALSNNNFYCDKYSFSTLDASTMTDKSLCIGNGYITVKDLSYTDANAFKSAISGVYLYYELATEITFSADGNEKITSLEKHFEVNNFSVPHESKNLIPYPYINTTTERNGGKYTDLGDGRITVSGTFTARTTFELADINLDSGKSITLAIDNGDKASIRLSLYYKSDYTQFNKSTLNINPYTTTVSGTYRAYIVVEANTTVNNLTIRPIILEGVYTEIPNCLGWLNSSALVDKALGKNLIPFPYADTSKTVSGITITVDTDGTIHANGTASDLVRSFMLVALEKPLNLTAGETYTYIPNCSQAEKEDTFSTQLYASDWSFVSWYKENLTFVAQSGKIYCIRLYVQSGKTLNDVTWKPMLVKGTVAPTKYEKWQGLTSADATKYTKYAKIETDKYGSDFIPQYVDYLPNGFCFTDSEQDDLSLLENGVHFLDDGILLLAESTPSTDVNLRIGGVV